MRDGEGLHGFDLIAGCMSFVSESWFQVSDVDDDGDDGVVVCVRAHIAVFFEHLFSLVKGLGGLRPKRPR